MTTKDLVVKQNTLPIVPNNASVESLDAYIRFANKVPMLTPEEEKELGEKLRDFNDIDAAQRLIMSHLRFVIKVSRGFSGYGLPQADLIQEGNIGLMKAVKRFNPDMGVRLVSFAVHWVKAEMHEYIIRNWRTVKIATTKAQRKLFFNLRNSKKRLGWFTQDEINTVAKTLNVKPSEVIEMERRMNAYDEAFDAPTLESDQDECFAPSQYLMSADASPEAQVTANETESRHHNSLYKGMEDLDERSQDIIQSRWLADKKATLHDLAAKYNISAERVRQLENQAMKALKAKLAA